MLITPSVPRTQMRRQTETPARLVTTLISPTESSTRTNLLEDDAGGQPMQKPRTSLRIILDGSPPAPTPVSSEILNRLMHRFSGQAKVYRDYDYQAVAKILWWKLPCGPQPQHHHWQSKRKWEAAMQGWRKELRKLRLEAAVVTLQQWFMQKWLHRLVHTEFHANRLMPIG